MRLLIDLQGAQGINRLTRAGRYALRLVMALAQRADGDEAFELHVLLNESIPDAAAEIRHLLAGFVPLDRLHGFRTIGPTAGCDSANHDRAVLSGRLRAAVIDNLQPDVLLITAPYDGYVDEVINTNAAGTGTVPVALLLHDLPAAFDGGSIDESWRRWIDETSTALRDVDVYLAVSAATAQRAAAMLREDLGDIGVIGAALDPSFRGATPPTDADDVIERLGIARPFILYTGSYATSRHVAGLLEAFAGVDESVREGFQLVLAGHAGALDLHRVVAQSVSLGLPDHALVLTGHVVDYDLRCLYHRCHAFVHTNDDDGAFASLLEAVACSAPVIAVRTEAAHGLVDPACLIEEGRHHLEAALHEVFADPARRHVLVADAAVLNQRFLWQDVATRVVSRLRECVGARDIVHHGSSTGPRKRLALVAPLPPASSGIADYCAELIPALANLYEIELISAEDVVDRSLIPPGMAIRSTAWFEDHAADFDRILYHFGNSPFHRHMFSLLDRFPGVVVLHDFYLSEVLAWIEHKDPAAQIFSRAVAHSHGPAGQLMKHERGVEHAVTTLPCNLRVLEMADGVIVHSRHAAALASAWYGASIASRFVALSFPRSVKPLESSESARQRLELAADDVLICSFGMIAAHKLVEVVVAAMAALPDDLRRRCTLVFVGATPANDYGRAFAESVSKASACRIRITGHVSVEEYRRYLACCDLAVQLRGSSRGETSAAVFDALGAGVPLIVNDHASLSELPREAVLRLDDEAGATDLADAIASLIGDPARRATLSDAGRALVATQHHPDVVARHYEEAIEVATAWSSRRRGALIERHAVEWITTVPRRSTPPIELAVAVSKAIDTPRKRRLFVDVTAIANTDLKTGIQRTVRALLLELLRCEPDGYRVELVRADRRYRVYRYASSYLDTLLDLPARSRTEDVVAPASGDLFLGLDLSCDTVVAMPEWFRVQHDHGMQIAFVVYDILPVRMKDMFPADVDLAFQLWLQSITKIADLVMCISAAVADDVIEWLDEHQPLRRQPLRVGSFPLGADLGASAPSRGLPPEAPALLQAVGACRSFLMVGTVEPRKGHEQVLAAIDLLWEAGEEVALVIVGKRGWMMDPFFQQVAAHDEFGRRLFWPQDISDEFLESLYPVCTALIAASHGEGFGLPLIEAAQHGLPLIARDLKVFREVAGDHAYYFRGRSADALAESLRAWLALDAEGRAPRSMGLTWYSWKDSAVRLVDSLMTGAHQRDWHCDRWIRYGEDIPFDSIKPDWDGWWQAEPTHRWNDGRQCRLGLVAPRTCRPRSRLQLRVGTFGEQRVAIRLNGVLLFTETSEMSDRQLDLEIPLGVLIAGEKNWLQFDLPDAKSPGRGDERLLGLHLLSLTLA